MNNFTLLKLKKLIKLTSKIILMPISIPCLLITAMCEFIATTPDWKFWREQNTFLIKSIPLDVGALIASNLKKLIKFMLRILFMVISIPCLIATAIIELASDKPDWEYWKKNNAYFIEILPWAKL